MLYNKIRPTTFDGVVGQTNVVESLRSQSKIGNFFDLYILSGQFGGGKTTVARILGLAVNCEHKDENGNPCLVCPACKAILGHTTPDIVEIDGASNNGVDKVRELIATLDYQPMTLTKKVIIIDEVHMLSKAAFNALLKTLEEPPEHCKFVLCTTDEDSIPATVKSRSAIYRFCAIGEPVISSYLADVARKEGICAEKSGLKLLAHYSQGSLRNALALLEQAALSGTVTEETVLRLVGAKNSDQYFTLLSGILRSDVKSVVEIHAALVEDACDFVSVVSDMIKILSDMVSYSVAPETVKGSDGYLKGLKGLQELSVPDISPLLHLSDSLFEIKKEMKQGGQQSFLLQLLMFMKTEDRIALLEKRVLDLEEGRERNVAEKPSVIPATPDSNVCDNDGFHPVTEENINPFAKQGNEEKSDRRDDDIVSIASLFESFL